jgi:hypothetical protein
VRDAIQRLALANRHYGYRRIVYYGIAASVEWTYYETVSSQSTEGNYETSSFVAHIVNLSRRSASHWAGGRAVAKFDAERHLQ